ncbi:hypothetical protein FB446DRAFT_805239 [Lentinula raphanica]|nr:hypothetical protein FB446DRAFT_805239 [Lentinula raphanica]
MSNMNTTAYLPQYSNIGSMFKNANNFTVNNSMFNHIGRDFIHNISTTDDGFRGLHLLYKSMAVSAVHNAETSYRPVKCHEGTREAILSRLADWITDMGRDTQLCWLHGSAGAGKSSVAQTIAERFEQEKKLAASFFFWRSDPTCNNIKRLIPTLAFQIAISIPALRPAITSVVENNFMILDASLETQFRELILRPFQNLGICKAGIPLLVVLDGLDECTDGRDQERVLLTIANSLQSKSIPLLFLVTSRPEYRIRNVFDKIAPSYMYNQHALEDSSEDIRRYLSDKLAEINCRRILSTHSDVEQPWPTRWQLDKLVYKASGQFIFASTVVKFVDGNFSLPPERLRIVLGSANSREQGDIVDSLIGFQEPEDTERPFRELDRLYREILSVNQNTPQLLRILGATMIFPNHKVPRTNMIERLLSLKPGGVCAALSGIHSLLKFDPKERIQFAHKSLTDFLLDPNRSGRFFIDRPLHHNLMARRCLKFMMDAQSETKDWNFGDEWSSAMYDNSPMAYHHHWGYHCMSAIASPELIRDLWALDLVAYADNLYILASEPSMKLRSAWLFIVQFGFFIAQVKHVQCWLEESADPPRDLIQHFEEFLSDGLYVSTSVSHRVHFRWQTQIAQCGKLLTFGAVVSNMDPDLEEYSLYELTTHGEDDRNQLPGLNRSVSEQFSTEDPLLYWNSSLQSAIRHSVFAIPDLKKLSDHPIGYLYSQRMNYLQTPAIPRQDLQNFLRSFQLEDDNSKEVYKVSLEWQEVRMFANIFLLEFIR